MTPLIQLYSNVCNLIVKEFEEKQGIYFIDWVDFYEIAGFSGEYFLNLSDIITDIRTNQAKGVILKWHDESIGNGCFLDKKINYTSYILGIRYE